MGHGHEHRKKHPATKHGPATATTTTTPTTATTGGEAVAATPTVAEKLLSVEPIDFGEHVVGSVHHGRADVWNLGQGMVQIFAWADGNPAFEVVQAPSALLEAGRAGGVRQSIIVAFTPVDGRQIYEGRLVVSAVWPDGRIALEVVPLTARGRELDAAPHDGPAAVARRAREDDAAAAEAQRQADAALDTAADQDDRAVPAGAKRRFDRAMREAEIAAEALAAAQIAGVRLAEREAKSYEKTPAPRAFDWWSLVEVALSVGLAGVAGVVAKTLSSKLVGALSGATGQALKDSKAVVGVADAMKEAIKTAGKAALKAHAPAAPAASGAAAASDGSFSDNPMINFFTAQESILLDAGKQNAQGVSTRAYYLEPLLTSAPDVALDTMKALGDGLQSAASSAEVINTQALATESQWIALIARQSLGEQTVKDYQHGVAEDVHVTDLEAARPNRPDGMPGRKDGLLDIEMEPIGWRVVGAWVTGVSAEIGRRLRGAVPATLGVPIRLIVGGKTDHPLVITRDEAGRIRLTGDREVLADVDGHDGTPLGSEEQAIATATMLVDNVIFQPLPVSAGTDDATGVRS